VSEWDVSDGTNFRYMFLECSSFPTEMFPLGRFQVRRTCVARSPDTTRSVGIVPLGISQMRLAVPSMRIAPTVFQWDASNLATVDPSTGTLPLETNGGPKTMTQRHIGVSNGRKSYKRENELPA